MDLGQKLQKAVITKKLDGWREVRVLCSACVKGKAATLLSPSTGHWNLHGKRQPEIFHGMNSSLL